VFPVVFIRLCKLTLQSDTRSEKLFDCRIGNPCCTSWRSRDAAKADRLKAGGLNLMMDN